jgi:hypothetical protein
LRSAVKLRKIGSTGELLDEHHSLDCHHSSFDRRFAALETFTQLGLLPKQHPWSRSDHPAYSGVDRTREFLSEPGLRKMGFDQYHEPARELSQKVRTFARMMASLIEEAEAINWYEQRISIEKDPAARAIMKNAQKEEFKHFGMNLEFLLRQKKDWRSELVEILFTTGSIVKRGEAGEKKVD